MPRPSSTCRRWNAWALIRSAWPSITADPEGYCFVTDDPERAWVEHREGVFASFHYERQGVHPYSSLLMETLPDKPEDLPNWQRLFMTPDQAIAELREVFADSAPDELHLMAKRSGMSWQQSAQFLQNFAEKVIPAVKDL